MSKKQKKKNKNITTILIVLAVVILGSWVISSQGNKVDPASFADVETFALGAHYKGNEEAEKTLVEYADFQCPACRQAAPQVSQLVSQYGDQFQLEFKHFPLQSIHPNAKIAAQASEAAAVQGKFWEMHDMLFENQDEWASSFNPKKHFTDYAEELGLNTDRFQFDLESDEVKAKVEADLADAEANNLPGTPSFTFNGEQISIQNFVNQELDLEAQPTEESSSEEVTTE